MPFPPIVPRRREPIDMADVGWSTLGPYRVQSAVLYHDRPLTRWEWVRVHVLRRRDPRFVAFITFNNASSVTWRRGWT